MVGETLELFWTDQLLQVLDWSFLTILDADNQKILLHAMRISNR